MTITRTVAAVLAAAAASTASAGWIFVPCDYSIGGLQEGYIPDFDQLRDQGPLVNDGQNYYFDPPGLPTGGTTAGGWMYCVPTVATDWMAWLANHGYPELMPFFGAPTGWGGDDRYDEITATISEMGVLMSTSAGGTDGQGLRDGLEAWFDQHVGPGKFDVGSEGPSGNSAPSLGDVGSAASSGKLLFVSIGWYQETTSGHWQRNGGHVTALTGALDYCSLTDAQIRFRDPASDYAIEEYMSQSAFSNETYAIEYVDAHFRKDAGDPWQQRTHARLLGYGATYPLGDQVPFLDGFSYIMPLTGVAPGPGETITYANPHAPAGPTSGITNFEVQTNVIDLVASPSLDAVYFLAVDPNGKSLRRLDPLTRTTEVLPPTILPDVTMIEVDDTGRVYGKGEFLVGVWEDPESTDTFEAWSLPARADDFGYDDTSGRLFVLCSQMSAVIGFDTEAAGAPVPTIHQFPPMSFVAPQLAVHDGVLWIGSELGPELRSYRLESGATLLPVQTYFDGRLIGMQHLEVGDGPIVYGVLGEAVVVLDARGGTLEPMTGGFAALDRDVHGPFVLLDARWRASDDLIGPHILPTQFAASVPDGCAGDVDGNGVVDALDFLALIAAWGPNAGHPADLNDDGTVDAQDWLILIAAWGPCVS